jgi:hypothetical protein
MGHSKTVRIRNQIRKSKVHKYWFVFKLRNIFYQWRGTSSSMQLNTQEIHYPKTWSHGWWQVPMAPILSCTSCVTHQPLRENVHHEVCKCNLSQSKCFGSQTSCYSQTATQESGSYYLCIRLMQTSKCRTPKLVWVGLFKLCADVCTYTDFCVYVYTVSVYTVSVYTDVCTHI